MGDLSPNFSRFEFLCECGCGFDTVDADLLFVLQDLSDYFNNIPIEITGPNRCRKRNREIGGAESSQHILGKAVDFKVQGVLPDTVYQYLEEKYPTKYGLGLYSNRCHIDVRKNPARWDKT